MEFFKILILSRIIDMTKSQIPEKQINIIIWFRKKLQG